MKINEGIMVENVTNCYICGNKGLPLYKGLHDRLFSAPGTWDIFQCPNCRLFWLNPRPVPTDISKIYTTYFTHIVERQTPKLTWARKIIKNSILSTAFGYDDIIESRMIGRLLSLIRPLRDRVGAGVMYLSGQHKGKLLDVGCGNGRFLSKMRKLGWEVFGIEPDAQAVKVAKEHFGVDVFCGTLEEANLPDNSFDAITMRHVIEHVSDPIKLFRECHRVLKVGGKLVVITPNSNSLGHRIFQDAWLALDPPRHMYVFSPKNLPICVERAGLQTISLYTISRTAIDIWQRSRLIQQYRRDNQRISMRLRIEGVVFQTIEELLRIVKPYIGEEIVLIAKKGENRYEM